jgi:threonine aldolase
MNGRKSSMTLDFRSDTITQPTDEMRHAMAAASVGDDVYGEDPTISELEERSAEMVGKEAALFVPSGTMANQIAIWVHSGREGQVLLEENCHISLYEGGAASLISGVTLRTVSGERGIFSADQLRRHIFPDDPHFCRTKLVCVEQTHNWAGGTIWTPEQLAEVAGFAHANGAKVHMDGARIWNAVAASDVPATAYTDSVDTVMLCLSKGLSAPVGSILAGDADFIKEARRVRKALGGGMRQAGHLAAAGLLALDRVSELKNDHAVASALAKGIATIPKLQLLEEPETNIVYADCAATGLLAADFCDLMGDIGVRCLPRDAGTMVRWVAHRHVSVADANEAVRLMRDLLA